MIQAGYKNIRFSGDGESFAVKHGEGISVFSGELKHPVAIDTSGGIEDFGFSPDGKRLLEINKDQHLYEYELRSGKRIGGESVRGLLTLYSCPTEDFKTDTSFAAIYQNRWRCRLFVRDFVTFPVTESLDGDIYDPYSQCFLCDELYGVGENKERYLLRIPLYTLQELMEEGRKMTVGYGLSEQQKKCMA